MSKVDDKEVLEAESFVDQFQFSVVKDDEKGPPSSTPPSPHSNSFVTSTSSRKYNSGYIGIVIAWIDSPRIIFFPEEDNLSSPLSWEDSYFKGVFTAFDAMNNTEISFAAFDHGALPWGRSSSKGALASLCRLIGITTKSGSFNCCCIIHLLVAIIEMDILTIDKLFIFHFDLLRKYLFSRVYRDADSVIKDVLEKLCISDKVFVRTISRYTTGKDYYLSHEVFGNCLGVGIYLVFSKEKKHFFLAKPTQLLSSCSSFQDPSTTSPRVRMEDFDFGTHPDIDLSYCDDVYFD